MFSNSPFSGVLDEGSAEISRNEASAEDIREIERPNRLSWQ